MQRSNIKLKTIQGELKTKGELTDTISNERHKAETRIAVIRVHMDSAPLLGKETPLQLGMLKINENER